MWDNFVFFLCRAEEILILIICLISLTSSRWVKITTKLEVEICMIDSSWNTSPNVILLRIHCISKLYLFIFFCFEHNTSRLCLSLFSNGGYLLLRYDIQTVFLEVVWLKTATYKIDCRSMFLCETLYQN